MPIHLPPISRRSFLRSSLIAGTALALSPRLFAGEKVPTDPNSWALLSDIHISSDRKHIARGINMADNLAKSAQEIIDLKTRPAGVLVSGDCAFNKGKTEDYEIIADLFKPVRKAQIPVHLTLGNHDDRQNFQDVLKINIKETANVADKYVSLIPTPHANWLILDSLEKTLSTPGLLGEVQLQWLAKTLDVNNKKPAIIVLHHHPITDEKNPGGALKDTQKLLDILRPRQHVKAYFFGHTHNWNIKKDSSGIHLINLPPVAYVFDDKKPNGWVHAMLQENGINLELRCIDPKHAQHGQKTELKWRT